tara:strand:- start:883 stop:1425 length:543 start_codon:yes stop_codon:yes gene_type:complete
MPGFTQDDIIAHSEYQKLFKYRLIVRGAIPGVDLGRAGKNLDLLCLGYTEPEVTFNPIEGKIHGLPFHTAGIPDFNKQVPLQFLETEEAYIKNMFHKWSALMYDATTGEFKPKKEYFREVLLQSLKSDDTASGTYILKACFPNVLTGAAMNGETNDIHRADFTLNYLTFDYNTGDEPDDR